MGRHLFNPVKTRRRLTKRAGAAALGGVAALATTGAIVASAAVPAFPDNIVIFPNRDMVVAEGFQDRIGQLATVEVRRDGTLVGSTQAEFAESDDAAFEINHPGGACWGVGAGGNLQVTPDIQPGDVVAIKVDGAVIADTIVQDGFVDTDSVLNGNTLTITGHIGAGTNKAQVEQRVVNPNLTVTDVNRRDIRAVPGGLTPAPKGGYSSDLTFPTTTTFRATYVFNSADDGRDRGARRRRALHGLAGGGRRRQPPGPDHRRVGRARRPRHGRLPGRPEPGRRARGRRGGRRPAPPTGCPPAWTGSRPWPLPAPPR